MSNINTVQAMVDQNNIYNSDYFTVSVSYLIANSNDRNDARLQAALNAFLNLDGEDWYPTVTFKKPTGTNPNGRTTVAITNYVNNTEISEAYEKNALDELELIRTGFTETTHANKRLLLMEISQCGSVGITNAEDEFINCDNIVADGGNTGGGNNQSGTLRLRINDMKVKWHKEPWPFRSGVHFSGFKLSFQPTFSGDCGDEMEGSPNCYNYEGFRIKEFKRKWIKNGNTKTVDYLMKEDSNFANPPDFIFYTIFEKDSWPAYLRGDEPDEVFYFPNNEYRIIKYRSWEEDYDSQLLSQDSNNTYSLPFSNNFSTENGGIKYNLTRGQ